MRLLLPIIAGSLIALVVAWPQFQEEHGKLVPLLQSKKIQTVDQTGQRLTKAKFTGVDSNNQPYTITADAVTQADQGTDQINLRNPQADITLKQGAWLSMSAPSGTFAKKDGKLTLSGGVNIFHDQGYEFHTASATIELKQKIAYGNDPVEGFGPFGELDAHGFRIANGGKTLYFIGDTNLVLLPPIKKAKR